MRTPKTYPFVIILLSAWKAAGHPVGVDTHLQIVELLKKLPAGTEPERLKTLIAPILTGDPQKQQEFYTLFDRLPKIEPPFRLDNLLILLVFIGLLGIIIYFIFKKTDRLPIEYTDEIINIDLNDPKGIYCPDTLGTEMRQFSFLALDTFRKTKRLRIIPTSKCFEYQGVSVGRDTVYLRIVYKNLGRDITGRSGANASITLNRRVIFNIDSRNTGTTTFDIDTLAYKPYQHNPSIESLRAEHIPIFSLKYAYFDWQKLAILVGIFLFLLQAGFLRNLIQYRQQKRASEQPEHIDIQAADLKRKPNDKPPFTWQLRIPNAGHIQTGEDFAAIVQQLGRRSESDQNIFDSQRTIRATINNGGRIVFRYRQPTQANEYLLLIDTLTVNDHRAQLFNFIYQEFSNNEILIERFYYDGDLRLCWNEQHPKGLSIRELQYKFSNHRLLIVGTGDRLINPLSGQLERWTNIFEQWRNRALISTRPINQWSEEETQLGSKFHIVPATLRGLADLVQERDAGEAVNFQKWKKAPDELAIPLRLPTKLSPVAVFANLEAEYIDYPKGQPDDRMLQWIAACAISPVLHWDATLFFGEQIDGNANNSLLTVENLMRLNRLNWFIEGKMPDAVRTHLLDWLKKDHLEQLVRLRSAWKHLLEQNLQQFQERSLAQNQTSFNQTVAYEQLRMTIVVNELALDDLQQKLPPQQRQQLERELRDLNTITSPDVVALELLQQLDAKEKLLETSAVSEATKEDFPGLLSGWRWQLSLLLIGFFSILGFNDKSVAACKNSSVSLNGNIYCINSPQDSLTYLEYLFCDTAYRREVLIAILYDISSEIKPVNSVKIQEFLTAAANTITSQDYRLSIDFANKNLDSSISFVRGYLNEDNDGLILKKAFELIRERNLDSASFYKNIPLALWNKGTRLYNAGLKDSACNYFEKLYSWKWRDSVISGSELLIIKQVCSIEKSNEDIIKEKKVVPVGTVISLEIDDRHWRLLNFNTFKIGQIIPYTVYKDVVIDGEVIIKRGAYAEGVVTDVKKKIFKGAIEIYIRPQNVENIDGERIRISSTLNHHITASKSGKITSSREIIQAIVRK